MHAPSQRQCHGQVIQRGGVARHTVAQVHRPGQGGGQAEGVVVQAGRGRAGGTGRRQDLVGGRARGGGPGELK